MLERPNHYAGSSLDRVAARRRDPDWISRQLADGAARVVPLWRGRNLVADAPDGPRAVLLGLADALEAAQAAGQAASDLLLLGLRNGAAVFAADLSAVEEPESLPRLAGAGRFADLREFGPVIDLDDAALLAYSRGLAWWHQRHRHCGVCGAPTVSVDAGHVRRCGEERCAASHFPRTDPAVIMLVHDGGDRALLGRHGRFPPGMYSTLAGFVEPGESLEEAVAREVGEEVGVAVADVRYHSSQPWPFPGSIMLGFTARTDHGERDLRVDPEELEHARWFTRAELLAARDDGPLRLPRRDSIARRLIEDWLSGNGQQPGWTTAPGSKG
ncbi:MAG TPA: NAD(+) diphosphatase [Arenibaculum sp.]|nr:NAD(+) diphosphatase [Arenibaculum sp.]